MTDIQDTETHNTSAEWPPKMAVFVGTVVLQGQRVLFVRQAEGHSLAGQWSIPWGVVDNGESPEDAALRETYEESSVKAEIEGLLGIQNLRREGWLGIAFLCRHVEGAPVAHSDEIVHLFQLKPSSCSNGSRPLVPSEDVQFE
jgi:ADP-ribose pyrophosphatase YjhB (NUDIX family)